MQLKVFAASLVLAGAVGLLCERAIHGPPELILIWLLVTIGVAIEGVTLLAVLSHRDEPVASAVIHLRPASRHCRIRQ